MPNIELPSALNTSLSLAPGDVLPNWLLRDTRNGPFSFYTDSVIGHCQVIVVCPSLEQARPLLDWHLQHAPAFERAPAKVHVVAGGPGALTAPVASLHLLTDPDNQIGKSLGRSGPTPFTVMLLHNNHLAAILDGNTQGERALMLAEAVSQSFPSFEMRRHHPPVLLIPDVFSHEECRALIEVFHTRGQDFRSGNQAHDVLNGRDYKMRVAEHMREDRVDHFFFEQATLRFLERRLNRVLPEIYKAFQYRVSRYESLRMACYRGARGGHGHGHRDNVPPHVHRRFAMSINLNTEEFEGGELRFPEFADVRYRPASGSGIVFSSSLVHEALQVTSGTRYVFLVFLFGEQ